jgi:hypothetical protein
LGQQAPQIPKSSFLAILKNLLASNSSKTHHDFLKNIQDDGKRDGQGQKFKIGPNTHVIYL